MSLDDVARSLTGRDRQPVMTLSRRYAAAPTDVWSAITEPERLARWLGAIENVADAGGDRFLVRFADAPESPAEARVERCAAPERLVVSWDWPGERPSVLSVTLVPDGDGTLLTLEHRLGEPDHVAAYGGGWEQCLSALAALYGESAATESPEREGTSRWTDLSERVLTVEVELPAPRSEVWRALTTVEGLRSWWWNHWDDVEITADAQRGGAYRFVARAAGILVEGVYLDVEPSEHLSFTWNWTDDEGTTADEACDLRLDETATGCRLTLRHTGPWTDDAPAESYRQGWEFVLAALSRMLAA